MKTFWRKIVVNDDGTPFLGDPWAGPFLLAAAVIHFLYAAFF